MMFSSSISASYSSWPSTAQLLTQETQHDDTLYNSASSKSLAFTNSCRHDKVVSFDSPIAYLKHTLDQLANLTTHHQDKLRRRLSLMSESERLHLESKLRELKNRLLEKHSKFFQPNPSTHRGTLRQLGSHMCPDKPMLKGESIMSSTGVEHNKNESYSSAPERLIRKKQVTKENNIGRILIQRNQSLELDMQKLNTKTVLSQYMNFHRPRDSLNEGLEVCPSDPQHPLENRHHLIKFSGMDGSRFKNPDVLEQGIDAAKTLTNPQTTTECLRPRETTERGEVLVASEKIIDSRLRAATGRRDITVKYPNCVESIMWRVSVSTYLWDTERFFFESPAQGIPLWWRERNKDNENSGEKQEASRQEDASDIEQACHLSQNLFQTRWHLSPELFRSIPGSLFFFSRHSEKKTACESYGQNKNDKELKSSLKNSNVMNYSLTIRSDQYSANKRGRESITDEVELTSDAKKIAVEKGGERSTRHSSQLYDLVHQEKAMDCCPNGGSSPEHEDEEPLLINSFFIENSDSSKQASATLLKKAKQKNLNQYEDEKYKDFDSVKKQTGWHPYVWYLMCRRPELYNIGIRAGLVVRVAGWEWEDVQKEPDVLQKFLQRIIDFLCRYPVPKGMNKKEAKKYKRLAANSVRTPWQNIKTPAVLRAL